MTDNPLCYNYIPAKDVKAKKSNSLSSIAKCLLVSKKKRILRTRDKDFFEELQLTSLGNS